MCGIFAYLSVNPINKSNAVSVLNMANKIRHRGPDQTNSQLLYNGLAMLVFHRLKIVDLSKEAIQPFNYNGTYSICNGELYNYISLKKKYNLSINSNCDCEIINPLLEKIGIKEILVGSKNQKLAASTADVLALNLGMKEILVASKIQN